MLLVASHGWALLKVATRQPGTLAPETFSVLGSGLLQTPPKGPRGAKRGLKCRVAFQEPSTPSRASDSAADGLVVGSSDAKLSGSALSQSITPSSEMGQLCGGLALERALLHIDGREGDVGQEVGTAQVGDVIADQNPNRQPTSRDIKLVLWDRRGSVLILFVDIKGICKQHTLVSHSTPQQENLASCDVPKLSLLSCSSFVWTMSYSIPYPYVQGTQALVDADKFNGVTSDVELHVFSVNSCNNSQQEVLLSCRARLSDLWVGEKPEHNPPVQEVSHMNKSNNQRATVRFSLDRGLDVPTEASGSKQIDVLSRIGVAPGQQSFVTCMTLVGGAYGLPYVLVQALAHGELLFCSLAAYGIPKPLYSSSSTNPLVGNLPVLSTASGHIGAVTCFLEVVYVGATGPDEPVPEDVVVVGGKGKPILVSGGADGSVRFWSLEKQELGKQLFAVHAHTGILHSAFFATPCPGPVSSIVPFYSWQPPICCMNQFQPHKLKALDPFPHDKKDCHHVLWLCHY